MVDICECGHEEEDHSSDEANLEYSGSCDACNCEKYLYSHDEDEEQD